MDKENIFEYDGVWHKKGKDGNCESFTMSDLNSLLKAQYEKGVIDGSELTGRIAKEEHAIDVANKLIEQGEKIDILIAKEIVTAHKEGTPTARLTSLSVKIKDLWIK